MRKSIALAVIALSSVAGAQTQDSVSKLAQRIDHMASAEPPALAADVRLQVADAVLPADPELSRRIINDTITHFSAAAVPGLMRFLATGNKEAARLAFRQIPFGDPNAPQSPWVLLQLVVQMASSDPIEASAAALKLRIPADSGDYRRSVAALLHSIDPQAYQKQSGLVEPDITALSAADSFKLARKLSLNLPATPARNPAPDPAVQAIGSRFKQLRGDISKSERAKLAIALAADIGALPDPQTRLGLANALSNLATEGDLGREALQAVTDTLSKAIADSRPKVDSGSYLQLAKLVRYEHMRSAVSDPSLASRIELLHLRELAAEQTEFTLNSLEGKSYSLKDLRGKVVVVNFWATWCPPCRKEMPDLEQLSQRFRDQGLVVLAISDEPADTVKPFIAKQGYTFPVLLDPERKANAAFHIEGIPKTFIFGRDGKLAAHAIDMRTSEQFLALLRQAGLK